MNKDWRCKIGIHKWRNSATFSNAVPVCVRNELRSDILICTRCCKTKVVRIK